ncbi:hypothetical protein PG984_011661 [Apiospora sp. TS-2023a]
MAEQLKVTMAILDSIFDPNDPESKSRFSDWGGIAASCGMTEPHAKKRFGEMKGVYAAFTKEAIRTKPVIKCRHRGGSPADPSRADSKKRDESKPAPMSRL